MSPQPLVTVILTSYNHGAFIEESLHSVLQQSIEDIEVFVIDDASSDDTSERLSKVRDSRVRLVRNEHNRGRHLRNWALSKASGTLIAFQNSDDAWLNDKLATQVEYMRSHPGCGACFTAVELRDEAGAPCPEHPVYGGLFHFENYDRFGWLRRFFLYGNFVALPSAVIRRSVLTHTGLFDPCLFQVADYDLWVRIAGVADLAVLPEPLTLVRVQADGRNVSAPSPAANNRSYRETVEVLCRYGQNPILSDIDKIFGFDTPGLTDTDTDTSRLAKLGLYATGLELRPQKLAGVRLLMQALRQNESEPQLSEQQRSRIALHLFRASGGLDF